MAVNDDSEHDQGIEGFQAAFAARSRMKSWAEGLEIIELLRAVHRAGWLERLRVETAADELAAAHGVSAEQVSNVLAVLASAGVVQRRGTSFRLSPEFGALVAGTSGFDMKAVLGAVDLARHQAAQAVQPLERRGLDGEQALLVADDGGVRATPGTRQMYGMAYDAVPEYRERLERGGPLLDVGSGIGGALLTSLQLFETLRAVGVEIVPEVADELSRRTKDAGVSDRTDIRNMNAVSLRDESVFTACFWAQPFFPVDVRADTLAAIFRALRPDGLLLVQELFPPLTTQDEPSTRAQLDRLFFRQLNMAYGMSAEELVVEGRTAGFRDARIAETPLGRLVLLHKPD